MQAHCESGALPGLNRSERLLAGYVAAVIIYHGYAPLCLSSRTKSGMIRKTLGIGND